MPKKPFEELPYNPIEANLARDAAALGQTRTVDNETAFHRGQNQQDKTDTTDLPGKRSQSKSGMATTLAPKSEVGKRFSLTREEDLDLADFLQRLQRQSGTKVALSLLIRASLTLLMHAESEILTQMRTSPPPTQPATHNSLAYAEFEHYWVQLLQEALRHTRPVR